MIVLEGIKSLYPIKNALLTQGTFDGVHIGHRKILQSIIDEAKSIGGKSVLITFYPHPRLVIHPEDNHLKLLTTITEKREILANLGIDYLIVLPFEEISEMSPLTYIRDLIVAKINPSKMVVGYDHRFGKNRSGGIAELEKFAETFQFAVEQIGAKMVEEITVSSTKIRNALADGYISLANEYLGYSYQFAGTVIQGMQIGRTIGYRTANIQVNDFLKRIPGNGIYAARAKVKNKLINGMLSIGTNPTIKAKGPSIEIHLFDFDEDIYGLELIILPLQKIREEKKFNGLNELKEQLKIDEANCKKAILK